MLKLKIPPPAYMLIFATLMWLLNKYVPIIHWILPPGNKIGLLAIAGAFLMDLSSLILFFRKHTTPNPFKPDNASHLVTSGMYRITRNPMYLGLLIILSGWAVYLGSVTPFLLLPLFVWVINVEQIFPEEEILEKKFGQQYRDYKEKVRRWI